MSNNISINLSNYSLTSDISNNFTSRTLHDASFNNLNTSITNINTSISNINTSISNRFSYFNIVLQNTMNIGGTDYFYYSFKLNNYTLKQSMNTTSNITAPAYFRSFKVITFLKDLYLESRTALDNKNCVNNCEIFMSYITYANPSNTYPSYYKSGLNVTCNIPDNKHMTKIYNDGFAFLLKSENLDELLILSLASSNLNCIIIDYLK